MARKKATPAENGDDPQTRQQTLVPMSEEELKAAGRQLARLVRDLDVMEIEHEGMRREMRDKRDKLRERISGVSETIRTQGR